MRHVAVIDHGKSNTRVVIFDAQGRQVDQRACPTPGDASGPYPVEDVAALIPFVTGALKHFAARYAIATIVPVAHGAAGALVDADGLVLPVLDYEYSPPDAINAAYDALRPSFAETASPRLPAGHNLGRQLYLLQTRFPEAVARANAFLPLAQYWAWVLSGVAVSEVTSLGAHTDLWNPWQRCLSALVADQGWGRLIPPMRKAGEVIGPLRPEMARATGLAETTPVLAGLHDSNASLLPYLSAGPTSSAPTSSSVKSGGETIGGDTTGGEPSGGATSRRTAPVAVVSTGTWIIVMNVGGDASQLDPAADMLANVDVLGRPTPSARFMGGREFAEIAGDDAPATLDGARAVIESGALALPSFSDQGGPWAGVKGRLLGPLPPIAGLRSALACLYCALVTHDLVTRLGIAGPLYVDGPFAANAVWLAAMAGLHDAGIVPRAGASPAAGAAMLALAASEPTLQLPVQRQTQPRPQPQPQSQAQPKTQDRLPGLERYRQRWVEAVARKTG
ncbi:MAG: FGGY family carbohydrate kinase [Pseudomonadota bacterium]